MPSAYSPVCPFYPFLTRFGMKISVVSAWYAVENHPHHPIVILGSAFRNIGNGPPLMFTKLNILIPFSRVKRTSEIYDLLFPMHLRMASISDPSWDT